MQLKIPSHFGHPKVQTALPIGLEYHGGVCAVHFTFPTMLFVVGLLCTKFS